MVSGINGFNSDAVSGDFLSQLTGNNGTTTDSAKWQEELLKAMGQDMPEQTEDTISLSSTRFKRKMPPPPMVMLNTELITALKKALEDGTIDDTEAANLKKLMEEQDSAAAGGAGSDSVAQLIKTILIDGGYLEAPEDNSVKSLSESDRLAALKKAVAAAVADEKLTADQAEKLNAFINKREEFLTLIGKVTTTDTTTETTQAGSTSD